MATTTEITACQPLLAPLDPEGVVVTADALDAQVEHGHVLVATRGADYAFTVKDYQPGLKETLAALDEGSFSPGGGGGEQGPRPPRAPGAAGEQRAQRVPGRS